MRRFVTSAIAVALAVLPIVTPASGPRSADEWYALGAEEARARGADPATGKARNLILFLGDGMGPTTVTAARILAGQRAGGSGEEHRLAFETLPYTALAKTYNTDAQTPDSAGTMTAIVAGVKTRMGVVGVGPEIERRQCRGDDAGALASLFDLATRAGMATGLVTSTRLTHATPAALYAKSPERNWESDDALPESAATAGCRDIAAQFVEHSARTDLRVALAGGRQAFLPETASDPEYPAVRGWRRDGRDLIAEWQRQAPDSVYVWNRAGFEAAVPGTARRLLGLFEPSHLRFEHDRWDDPGGEPSLAEMTDKALDFLETHPGGYVLMVEGGRIDHAHHLGNAHRALTDTLAFDAAVAVALARTRADRTLIVVTADHSHTLSFAGYPQRGNPILDVVRWDDEPVLDAQGRPYTTLSYANGPGHRPDGRPDLRQTDTRAADFLQEATVPLESETHGGEDVTVHAGGPGAESVRGTIEQNSLFHLMAWALAPLRSVLCPDIDAGVACDPARRPRPGLEVEAKPEA